MGRCFLQLGVHGRALADAMESRRGGPFGTFSETCHCERWPHSHICSRWGAKVPTERGRRRSSTDGGGSLKSRPHFAHFGTVVSFARS